MDGLALLCNLYTDGPVTLERLRAARVTNLAELERVDPVELAAWLQASVPQARALATEAQKLLARLAEERSGSVALQRSPTAAASSEAAPVGPDEAPADTPETRATATDEVSLRPGLFPGLDEALCARLARHDVRSVRALCEFAGLALARRTGIPYGTLLELARGARSFAATRRRPPEPARPQVPNLATVEIRPFLARPKRAPSEAELTPTDGFTLPVVEPEVAGPFG